ncbi:MAG: hypothetical protein WD533_03375, partial [Dehalococcoidia bacterium]
VSRTTAAQQLGGQQGRIPAAVRQVERIDVSGNSAVVEWVGTSGIALERWRAEMRREGERWVVAGIERLDSPIPKGVNATIPVRMDETGLDFSQSLVDGGYVGFRVENQGDTAYAVALVMDGEWIATTRIIAPGEAVSMGFAVPLERGSYTLVPFIPPGSMTEDPQLVQRMSTEFDMPYLLGRG